MILSDVFLRQPEDNAPTQISMALQTVKGIESDVADIYEEFIERANIAEIACRETGIQVLGQYKLTDALPSNLNPDEATNTLLLIFQFYAKIKTASSHATFSAAEEDVNFMSFSKVEIFCRDFKVVPRLLTREELKMLWGDIGRAHVLAGRGVFTVIDFDEFKDLIIRMALWAYHKPGLKKLIITLEGFMPRNAQILQSFCHYLRLPEVQFINNFIRTKGRQTQGELNYRSKGETNLRTRMEVRADTDARKLSQVKSSSGGSGRNSVSSSSKTPGKGKKVNMFGELEYEERQLRGANPKRVIRLQPMTSSPMLSAEALRASSTQKEKPVSLLPPSLAEKFQPMDASALMLLLRQSAAGRRGDGEDDDMDVDDEAGHAGGAAGVGGNDEDDGFALDSNPALSPRSSNHNHNHNNHSNKSSVSGSKKNQSQLAASKSSAKDRDSDDDDEVLSTIARENKKNNMTWMQLQKNKKKKQQQQQQLQISTAAPYRFVAPDELSPGAFRDDDDDDDNVSIASSVLSVFHDSSLEALRAAYEADYDIRLSKQELARYCYVPPVANSTDFLPTKGPVADLGLLQGGAKVTLQLRVSNGSGDDIFVDASARDFYALDTHISTYSKMLIPGMARHVCVTFTVPKHNCRVLGMIDVVCVAPRHGAFSAASSSTRASLKSTAHYGRSSNNNTNSSYNNNNNNNNNNSHGQNMFVPPVTIDGVCRISCPVFYRVDCVAHADVFPVLTAGSLRPLMSRSSRRSPLSTAETNLSTMMGSTPNMKKKTTMNVLSNSRMGSAHGQTQRSDWDTTFMAQRLPSSSSFSSSNAHRSPQNHQNPLTGTSRPGTAATTASEKASDASLSASRWPSGRWTTLTELPSTRTGQQVSVLPDGSSPFVPRTVERQHSLPRPQSPVPPSMGGSLTPSASAQFQRTASSPLSRHNSNGLGGGQAVALDSDVLDASFSPDRKRMCSNRSQPRLLDNLNKTANF